MPERIHPRFLLTLLLICLGAGAPATEAQMGVSPGETARITEVEDGCPTFSWSSVNGARAYELVVYRLTNDGRGVDPVLHERFDSPADGWTPPLDRCLEAGGSYGWSVRATRGARDRDWSPLRLFRVVEARSPPTLDEALEVVRTYLEAVRVRSSAIPNSASIEALAALAGRSGLTDSTPAESAVGGVKMSVDGRVEATSFAGDGSALTDIDPANFFLGGVANISVTGSSLYLDCTGCVSWLAIGDGQVTSADIKNGQVTGSDIDLSTVQARIGSCDDDSVIQAIGSDGSVTCAANTQVLSGQEHFIQSSGGGITSVSVSRANRLCFLSYVGFRDTWYNTSACKIELSEGGGSWVLFASSEGDSVAKCRMRCIEISPDRTE